MNFLLIFVILSGIISVQCEIVNIPGLGFVQGSITYGARTGKIIYQFLGLKYAESPSQQNRFKPPIPVLPWFGVKDVTQHGRICPNFNNLLSLPPEELQLDLEDCLHMSIYANNLTRAQNVPVMVYIHGGSFVTGSAIPYPPNYLLEQEIVLVVIQYRLGPLGFLSTMTEEIPGNAAVLDVLLALQFVQSHIHNFGGDSSRITIFGQSAGAAMVSALILSPIVPRNFYHRAIVQSGSAISSWTIDDKPIDSARDIGERAGCTDTTTITELNECFMNLDVFTLLLSFTQHMNDRSFIGLHAYGGNKFVVGGPSNIFPISPYQIMLNGLGRPNLPMMAGATKHDGTFILRAFYEIVNTTIGMANETINGYKMIDLMNRLSGIVDETGSFHGYMTSKLFGQNQLVNGSFLDMMPGWFDLTTVNVIKGPTFRQAQANAFLNPQHTYLYTFDYQGQFTRFGYGADVSPYPFPGGIHHSDENIYLFPFPEFVTNLNTADRIMSEIMVEMWTSFAIYGIPFSQRYNTLWSAMTNVTGPYLHIDRIGIIGANYLDEFTVTAREGLPYCEDCIVEFPSNGQQDEGQN